MFLFSSNSAYTLSFSNAPILSLLSSILVDRSIIESSDDAAVKEFDRVARIDENVVRHLVINLDK